MKVHIYMPGSVWVVIRVGPQIGVRRRGRVSLLDSRQASLPLSKVLQGIPDMRIMPCTSSRLYYQCAHHPMQPD